MSLALKDGSVLLRTLTGVSVLSIFLVVMWVPQLRLGFAVLVGALTLVGLYELYAIARARQISPETIGGMLAGTIVALSGYFGSLTLTNYLLYGGCLLVAALHVVRGHYAVAGLAGTIFGVVYVGWFAAHLVLLHGIPQVGSGFVTMLFVAVVLTDTAAFFVGRAIGKHKLAPKVSPGKTWEGAAGGFVFTILGMAVVWYLQRNYLGAFLPDWTLGRYLYAGMVLSIASQVGDLAESCLKRDAGWKDSGSFFPGHGGVLDRCDGFLFASPFLYYMAVPLFT
ncbi:MAG: hypothetical protein AMXMBFR82_37160 [Candidatus Hydrogenedentota bacterium]